MAFPNQTAIRQYIAQELGYFLASVPDVSSTTSALIDKTFPVASNIRGSSFYKDMYLFRPAPANANDKVRVIGTYAGTTLSGTFSPDATYTGAPLSSETYEIHSVVEPLTAMKTLINDALKRCFVVVEFTLTPVLNQTRHSLAAAAPWLLNPSWVRSVGSLPFGQTDRNLYTPYNIRGEAVMDGNVCYINHQPTTFNPTDTLYVQAIKPAYDHIQAAGSGAFGAQSGMNLETDVAPVPVEFVGWGGIIQAWRRYAQLIEPTANERILKNRSEAAALFDNYRNINFQLPQLRFHRLRTGGPRGNGQQVWGL